MTAAEWDAAVQTLGPVARALYEEAELDKLTTVWLSSGATYTGMVGGTPHPFVFVLQRCDTRGNLLPQYHAFRCDIRQIVAWTEPRNFPEDS